MTSVDRYQSLRILHGEENLAKIQNTKILIIGAGGIGCEVREITSCFNGLIKFLLFFSSRFLRIWLYLELKKSKSLI